MLTTVSVVVVVVLVCFKSTVVVLDAFDVVLVCTVVSVVIVLLSPLIYTGIRAKLSATIMKTTPMRIPIITRFGNAMIRLCKERNLD